MLKHYSYGIKRAIMLVDVMILVFAYCVSISLRSALFGIEGMHSPEFQNLIWILLVSSLAVPYIFSVWGIYDFRYKTFWQCANKIFFSHVINFMLITLIAYLFRISHFSRLIMVGFILISVSLQSLFRLVIKQRLSELRDRGYNYRRTLIVGLSDVACRIISSIEQNVHWGLRVDGLIREDDEDDEGRFPLAGKYPILGSLVDLRDILMREVVDNVIFCTSRKSFTDLKEIILDIEAMGIASHVAIANPAIRISSTFLGIIDGIPLITYSPIKLSPFDLMIKNLIDLVGGVIGGAIFLILYPIIGIAIKLDSPGPVLFKQKRMGENGRIFTLYKFRSMYQDAEQRKAELLARNQLQGAVFKIAEDPRITRVGKFLRKFSLDEWPQFINVLKREMSLIGTRPPTLDEVEKYDLWHKRRLSMKPGLTGLWQISGRNTITNFDDIVKLDLKYIDNWSVWYDLYILLKTLLVTLKREGVY
ncbi:MAG: sugar transferase [bacterium]|nr:sugar transferase [bacterium]